MPKLPLLSGREIVRGLERLGWEVVRRRGSHIILVKQGHIATLSVPDHREIAKGTLRAHIARADLSVEDFLAVL